MIVISKIFGWISFVVWSISFYPQVYTNYVKKTAEGITLDMNLYYILGYIFYSIYLFTMYYNKSISSKYEKIFNVSTTEIDLSDILIILISYPSSKNLNNSQSSIDSSCVFFLVE